MIRPMIVPRPAPIARSMPMSWRRSATMVRKVLKMMNPPMNSVRKPRPLNTACAMLRLAKTSEPPLSAFRV